MKRKQLSYGPVVIEDYFDDVRIGYYDDDSENQAIVYMGDMFLAMNTGYFLVPYKYIREVTTDDLWNRKQKISSEIGPREKLPTFEDRYKLLLELAYVEEILMNRLYISRFDAKNNTGSKLFISHSSKDKRFAMWLSVDLANAGHKPWLDEWEIQAGDSIPTQIGIGIQDCDFVLLLLSKNSVNSNWVEREWQAKYWKEVQDNKVMVIPIFLEDCEIPTLLQTKKYADFRTDYSHGFETLIAALLPKPKK